MFSKIQNENGITLVEILASIVLLTLVISMFLSVFPQMSTFNNKTGENLNATNVGKELLVKVKNNYFISSTDDSLNTSTTVNGFSPTIDPTDSSHYILKGTYQTFYIEMFINKTGEFTNDPDNQIYKVTINIKKDATSNNLTTMFGYIDRR